METSIRKSFKCEICDSIFKVKAYLKRHSLSVHERKMPFKCDICDYSCFGKSDMNRHIESVHERKRSFKCDICDYESYQKGNTNNMFYQSMKDISHSNVIFVTTHVL